MTAEVSWRKLNAAHLVRLVQEDVIFPDGKSRILPDLPESIDDSLSIDATLEMAIHNI
jgi:hypothetical protein